MRHNAPYPKCSRSKNASKCKQRENEECSCRECKQRGFKMHLNAARQKCVKMRINALQCAKMHLNAVRKKLHRFTEETTPHPAASGRTVVNGSGRRRRGRTDYWRRTRRPGVELTDKREGVPIAASLSWLRQGPSRSRWSSRRA